MCTYTEAAYDILKNIWWGNNFHFEIVGNSLQKITKKHEILV